MLTLKIKQLSSEFHAEVTGIRHHLHANPELSFKEVNTSGYVEKILSGLDIPFRNKVAGTGITGLIEGKNPSKKVVALRADMDALPIQETNSVEYKSIVPGVMHACGHDVHTSCLLGAAKILTTLKNEFEGTVKLIFQPGEEKIPGGASLMIKEGVLEKPEVSSVIGQHVMPQVDVGKVGFRSGLYMASTDELYVTVYGKGGHGAMPHLNIDPVLISSHLIVSLQQIVSRHANPAMPSVLSFGYVKAEGETNVIPDKVELRGTFRTLSEEWRSKAHEKMMALAKSVVEGMGGKIDFEIRKGYPALVNNADVTSRAKQAAEEYLGKENVVDLDIWMAAEDFAYYSQQVPSCFYRLGVRNESKGIVSSVHTSTFNIDEDALRIGMGMLAYTAIKELRS